MKYLHDFIGEDNIVMKSRKVEVKSLEKRPPNVRKEYWYNQ